jgi:hypothetical protein
MGKLWNRLSEPLAGRGLAADIDLSAEERAAEIERRNRYWFEHYEDFRCTVVVRHDQAGPTVGVFDQLSGGLGVFGSFPTRSMGPVDSGEFAIAGTIVTVLGARRTWQWDLRNTLVGVSPDVCQFRRPNELVVYLQGPIMGPIRGAAWFNPLPGWDWPKL